MDKNVHLLLFITVNMMNSCSGSDVGVGSKLTVQKDVIHSKRGLINGVSSMFHKTGVALLYMIIQSKICSSNVSLNLIFFLHVINDNCYLNQPGHFLALTIYILLI